MLFKKRNQPKLPKSHSAYCVHCDNSGLCPRCCGAGCMDCDYDGVCPRCQTREEYYLEPKSTPAGVQR